jgi:transposase
MASRGPYRRHSTPFKLQLCQDIRAGVLGRRDAQRTHQISANLIQLRLTQFDRGELHDEEAEASVIAEYQTRIAALERKVGQLTMEPDLVKKTPRAPNGIDSGRSFIVFSPLIAAIATFALNAGCDCGAVVLSWSFPRWQHHAGFARKIHLRPLFSFLGPPLYRRSNPRPQPERRWLAL